MSYENLKLVVSPLTKNVYAGRMNKKKDKWLEKVDVTSQFIDCCIQHFKHNKINTIFENGEEKYEITIRKIEKKEN